MSEIQLYGAIYSVVGFEIGRGCLAEEADILGGAFEAVLFQEVELLMDRAAIER